MKLLFALPILALSAAVPAAADWLVGQDGKRVETRGAWTLRPPVVVFTSPGGTLSSLRLADVDLEASARATAEAKSPTAPVKPGLEPAKRQPVLVLTTDDVGRGPEPAEDAEQESDGEDPARRSVPDKAEEAPPVEVIAWRKVESSGVDGLEILGTLRNDSPSIVTGAGVQVSLFDHEGELIARRDAFLDSVSVAARSTTGFRALFPGVVSFEGEPVFEVRARELVFGVAGEGGEPDRD